MVSSSDLFAAGAEVGQNDVDAVLVDGAHGGCGNAQFHPTVLTGDPEAALVQVGEETTTGFVVGVRDVVAAHHALAGDLTSPGHDAPRSKLLSPMAWETAAPAHPGWEGATQDGLDPRCRRRAGIALPGPPGHRPGRADRTQ